MNILMGMGSNSQAKLMIKFLAYSLLFDRTSVLCADPWLGSSTLGKNQINRRSWVHVMLRHEDMYHFSVPRGGAQRNKSRSAANEKKHAKKHANLVLSAPELFVPINSVAEMTLSDLAMIFTYVITTNREGINNSRQPLSDKMQEIISEMNRVIAKSRSGGFLSTDEDVEDIVSLSQNEGGYGDIDALQFCAVCRIFAEWRLLRQTPEGFKKYSFGMRLGYKDVIENVAKIEFAVHQWRLSLSEELSRERQSSVSIKESSLDVNNNNSAEVLLRSNSDIIIRGPTLKQLLCDEIASGLHPKLPQLHDKSAAMGLLWTTRQLHYHATNFVNFLKVPEAFPSTLDAFGAAYSAVYGQFHSWPAKKIFQSSLKSTPSVDLLFQHMNPDYFNKAKMIAMKGKNVDDEDPTNNSIAESMKFEDLEYETKEIIRKDVELDSRAHIAIYLDAVSPILNDLRHLLTEMNCNDPKKV